MQVASFAAGAAWGHLSESSFFAGIAAGCDQAQEMLRSCTDASSVASFVGKLDFASFAEVLQQFWRVLTTPATEIVKLHCCGVHQFPGLSI